MTTQTEALKLVLEALNEYVEQHGQTHLAKRAMPKLREALAQPEQTALVQGWKLVPIEPTPEMRKAAADAWLDCGSKLLLNKAAASVKAGINAAPKSTPQPKEPEQEPVAKRLDPDDAWNFAKHVWNEMDKKSMPGIYMQMVTEAIVKHYTTPPQRKPLTDEQADGVALDVMGFAVLEKEQAETALMLIRATEAAHSIKGDA